MPDHIHVLLVLPRNVTVAQVVEDIKRNSSRWLKGVDDSYRSFAWQRGYGVCLSASRALVRSSDTLPSSKSIIADSLLLMSITASLICIR